MTYLGNPNGEHQLWSHWCFTIREVGPHAKFDWVKLNAARWLKKGFGTAGRARVKELVHGWLIECIVEGPQAGDPSYVESVRLQFQRDFVERGWNRFCTSTTVVKILSGNAEDGRPAAQMIELRMES